VVAVGEAEGGVARCPRDRYAILGVMAEAALSAPHIFLRVVNIVEVAPFAGRLPGEAPQNAVRSERVTALARGLDEAGRFHVQPMWEHEVRDDVSGKDTLGMVAVTEEALALRGRRVFALP
jgi:hypothetical protein